MLSQEAISTCKKYITYHVRNERLLDPGCRLTILDLTLMNNQKFVQMAGRMFPEDLYHNKQAVTRWTLNPIKTMFDENANLSQLIALAVNETRARETPCLFGESLLGGNLTMMKKWDYRRHRAFFKPATLNDLEHMNQEHRNMVQMLAILMIVVAHYAILMKSVEDATSSSQ